MILTTCLIVVIAGSIVSNKGGYFAPQPCGQLDVILDGIETETLARLPNSAALHSGENPDQHTPRSR